jgi:hypothetical protein
MLRPISSTSRHPKCALSPGDNPKRTFQNGLLAFQIIKPIKTCGPLFCVIREPDSPLSVQNAEYRPIMEPGGWALSRKFDRELLDAVPEAIDGILTIMNSENVERKNAFYLLQLGLEHFHPLIPGLLWVMGIDAIFDSGSGILTSRTTRWKARLFISTPYAAKSRMDVICERRDHTSCRSTSFKSTLRRTTRNPYRTR